MAVACAASAPAWAQSATAESLFEDGNKLMADGKLAEACESFEASNRVEARAGTLIRLGECREQNHQLASAWSAYKDALTRVKDPRKRDIATARIAALEPRLSYLTVTIADDHRVAGLAITRDDKPFDAALLGHALRTDGGDFTLVVRAPGHEDWTAVVHVPAEGGAVAVDIPQLREVVKPVAVTPPPPPLPIAVVVAATPARVAPMITRRRELALGAGGLAVISGVAAIALGASANSKQSRAFGECDPTQPRCVDAVDANSLLADARSRALEANVAYAAAGVLAIGAGVLWFTGGTRAEHLAIVPRVAPGQGGLAITGGF